MQHLHKTGRSLNTAVKTYNDLVGSLESRVLPQLRRLETSASWHPEPTCRILRHYKRKPARSHLPST
jgi:DNA anti-recombination protein RmuC